MKNNYNYSQDDMFGEKLKVTFCRACGEENPAGSTWCRKCGEPLSGALTDNAPQGNSYTYIRSSPQYVTEENLPVALRPVVEKNIIGNSITGTGINAEKPAVTFCLACGEENPAGSARCRKCGETLAGGLKEDAPEVNGFGIIRGERRIPKDLEDDDTEIFSRSHRRSIISDVLINEIPNTRVTRFVIFTLVAAFFALSAVFNIGRVVMQNNYVENGTQVPGTVSFAHHGHKTGYSITVNYTVDGKDYQLYVRRISGKYEEGQTVELYYMNDDPTDIVINNDTSMIIAVVSTALAVFVIVGFIIDDKRRANG